MENSNKACPEPDFKLFVRERFEKIQKCLSNKVSWKIAGVIVSILTAITFLVYNAYSGAQEEQCEVIKKNSAQVQALKTNVKVMEVEFHHIKHALEELKIEQKVQFDSIMQELKQIQEEGGERE